MFVNVVCVRACMRACVRACVRARMHVYTRSGVQGNPSVMDLVYMLQDGMEHLAKAHQHLDQQDLEGTYPAARWTHVSHIGHTLDRRYTHRRHTIDTRTLGPASS